ncbi:LamB/YcsF family protein [mine drainage metagenome]|uniref:LamB/YcsF family protein n=1 Tax=mine drainage metagenome TaxID=410659 RepID=A0A1J5T686_9ZZZZ
MSCIDLNCDMGEGLPTDAALMPFISSANIACGFHAGNMDIMKRTVEAALQHHVAIGAHPGFDDKNNFGRTEMQLSQKDLYKLISTQIILLHKICIENKTTLHHVKPHGALYNMASKNAEMANTIAQAIKDIDENLIIYGLSGSCLISEAKKLNLKTASEVFADRTYQDDGNLTSRKQSNALIEDENISVQQVLQMIQKQSVTSISNKQVNIVAETICIHGDGKHAVDFAKKINQILKEKNIVIKAI